MSFDWYVARVKPRNEGRVRSSLQKSGIDVYAPEIVVLKGGKELTEPLFPGYVFVHTDPGSKDWPRIRWTQGLSYFLPDGKHPARVPESLVDDIQTRVTRWNGGGWVEAFKPGDTVLIAGGSLRGLDAIFQRYIPGKRRCEVLVSLLGGPHRVKVDISDLQHSGALKRFSTPE